LKFHEIIDEIDKISFENLNPSQMINVDSIQKLRDCEDALPVTYFSTPFTLRAESRISMLAFCSMLMIVEVAF